MNITTPLQKLVQPLTTLQRQVLANVFEVSISTVHRWAGEVIGPHSSRVAQIKSFLEGLEERKNYGVCCQVFCGDCGNCPCCKND